MPSYLLPFLIRTVEIDVQIKLEILTNDPAELMRVAAAMAGQMQTDPAPAAAAAPVRQRKAQEAPAAAADPTATAAASSAPPPSSTASSATAQAGQPTTSDAPASEVTENDLISAANEAIAKLKGQPKPLQEYIKKHFTTVHGQPGTLKTTAPAQRPALLEMLRQVARGELQLQG